MPCFRRREEPPARRGDFREAVRNDFRHRCAYCLVPELLAGGPENFELDHFRPKSKFPQLENNFFNLYYSCHVCNHAKGPAWPPAELDDAGVNFMDLCRDDCFEHYSEAPDGRWIGLTVRANYTIELLRLNRKHLVNLRQRFSTKSAELCKRLPLEGQGLHLSLPEGLETNRAGSSAPVPSLV